MVVGVGGYCPLQGTRLRSAVGGHEYVVLEIILYAKGLNADSVPVFFGLKLGGDERMPAVGMVLHVVGSPA